MLKPQRTLILPLLLLAQTAAGSPGRDLVIDPNALDPFIEEATFDAGHCAVDHGCTQAGDRRLLKFTTVTRNIGDTDVVLGAPSDPNGPFEFDVCHGHYHYGTSARAELLDGAVAVAASEKLGFCLLDAERFDPNANPFPTHTCFNQGLSAGWADLYLPTLDCQWIDVTNIPGGTYTLRLTANPDGSSALEDPDHLENNVVEIEVVLPGAGAPVPTVSRWGLLLLSVLLVATGRLTLRVTPRPDGERRPGAREAHPRAGP